eukprot:2842164-Ditylum_brightwellii.AAC.1
MLKRLGKVVTAQSTASDSSKISSPLQYCWHMTIKNVWVDIRVKNKPTALFQMLHPFFQFNFNNICFICCRGTLQIMGDVDRAAHSLNLANDRSSMTALRSENTA